MRYYHAYALACLSVSVRHGAGWSDSSPCKFLWKKNGRMQVRCNVQGPSTKRKHTRSGAGTCIALQRGVFFPPLHPPAKAGNRLQNDNPCNIAKVSRLTVSPIGRRRRGIIIRYPSVRFSGKKGKKEKYSVDQTFFL